ncbi:MAG TPA: hypothetical protein VD948_10780 [Rhodothermales bacterium]|nr:hypothetical protein [Rhodothermales bacterium]
MTYRPATSTHACQSCGLTAADWTTPDAKGRRWSVTFETRTRRTGNETVVEVSDLCVRCAEGQR